jgi:hypothetical protein
MEKRYASRLEVLAEINPKITPQPQSKDLQM